MGQIADDMVKGVCCCLCGQFYEEEHGYPAVCNECWDGLTEEERAFHQKATKETI